MIFEVLGLYEHMQEEYSSQYIVNYRAYISTLVNPDAQEVDRERTNNKVLKMDIQKDKEAELLPNTQLKL